MKKTRHRLLTFSILITLSVAVIHIINKLISASANLKNLLKTKSGSFYTWRFGNIFYTKQGSGPPLLLVHDLTSSSSSEEWTRIVPALSQKYTVYTLDILGCGRSDKPKMTYTSFLYVQLLTDFVKNIIGQRTDVIASGLSGSFTVMTCANNDNTFGKIMLVNPESLTSLSKSPSKQSTIAKYLLELPLLGTLVYNILVAKPNVELLFTEKYLYNPFQTEQSMVNIYYEAAHLQRGNGKYLLSSIIGRYINCNIAHGLKSIDNSIFIVGGEAKEGINETVALYSSLNPSIEQEIIPATKHLPQHEAPEKLLELIRIFF